MTSCRRELLMCVCMYMCVCVCYICLCVLDIVVCTSLVGSKVKNGVLQEEFVEDIERLNDEVQA
jgi:hypothetical protein